MVAVISHQSMYTVYVIGRTKEMERPVGLHQNVTHVALKDTETQKATPGTTPVKGLETSGGRIKMPKIKENRLIVGSAQWAETIPEWILDEIRTERMVLGLAGITNPDIQKVGNAEVVAYLYTAGLAGPLHHDTAELYIYLVSKLSKAKGKTLEDFMEEKLKNGLRPDEELELNHLTSMIFQKRGGNIRHPLLDSMRSLKKKIEKKEHRT